MRKIQPLDLNIGDKIVDNAEEVLSAGKKPKLIPVQRIDHFACSKREMHVNNHLCYSYISPMWVQ